MTAREEAEHRIANAIDQAFCVIITNPDVIKELWKARNRCYKVLRLAPKPLPWASSKTIRETEQSQNQGRD